MAKKRVEKRVEDVTIAEALEFIRGLREVMYRRSTEWDGVGDMPADHWDPDDAVNGGDLVDWVGEEFERLGLTPPARPLREDES